MNQAPEAIRNIRQAADSATSRTDFQTIAFYGDSELQRQQRAYTADPRDLSRAENFWKEIHEEHEAHKGWKYPAATCELCEKERLLLTDSAGSYVSCPPKWMASPNPARQVGTPRVSKSTLSTKSSSLDSEEFSAEMPSEFDNFEFGFNDVDAEDPEMAPGLPVVQSQEEEQNLARPVHHTGLWQPAKHSIQLPIANQGLWSGLTRPTPHYTEYLFKSGPTAQPGAGSQHNAEYQYTPKPAPKPKPTPQFSEFLFKSKPAMTVPTATTSGTISAWPFGHTVGLKLIVTPPSIGGVDDEEMDFSLKANSNFLQVLGQSYSSPLFPAFVEVPQRIVDPGTSEGTAELENLQWIQEESNSWSDSDSDVTSTLSEEEGIDWSEARAPTPEELNPMRRFLDQEIGEVGYIYEEEQVPSCPSVSNSTLHGPPTREGTDNLETSDLDGIYSLYSSPQESSSPPPLTPAQTIILENQARLAEEFLER
ncbi:uncharacterized protein PAC_03909 [Phialocephala subalpina]|uniref:Uncharacterized protein n=1 Tax=Phialocephala subalpina TaxID=576137 RepID=A0A1L7WMP9_9HELO|nr:uncharacterized protein PAC_03909 [Phialocephala subalpina]